jgi:RES domain-containing protein
VRFTGTCYRAHDPRRAFKPLSGDGAAIHGGRFNPKGTPALYLSLSIETAIKEANQGFAFKIDPCVLCSYDVDCDHIADVRTAPRRRQHRVALAEMSCAWFADAIAGRRPASWAVYDRLTAAGLAGILVRSFAPGATANDHNLVLWDWSSHLPHRVAVFDPSGRLPKNQLSWE